jgi:hypothetical protein
MSKGTPVRTVRVPDAVWLPAVEKAGKDGIGKVIRDALVEYVTTKPRASDAR